MRGASNVISRLPARRFAYEQANRRLARVVFQTRRVLRASLGAADSADAIHDLRVATRRFRAVLDTFEQFFPKAEVKKIRKSIRKVFHIAGEVRNRDITIHLLEKSELVSAPPAIGQLAEERREWEHHLHDALRGWSRKDFSARWREGLNLP